MSTLLPWAITLMLLIGGGAAWFAALGLTRRERLELEHRVSLVGGAAESEIRSGVVNAPVRKALTFAGTRIRSLFSVGSARRWGMRTNGVTLIVIASVAGIAAWMLMHAVLQFSYWIAIPATAGAFMLAPRTWLRRQQSGAEQKFMLLFPDAIDMVIRMLRAGLPITASTRTVAAGNPCFS